MSEYDRSPNAKKDSFWAAIYEAELKSQIRFFAKRREDEKKKEQHKSAMSESRSKNMNGVIDEDMLYRLKNHYFPPLRKPTVIEKKKSQKPISETVCLMYPIPDETKRLLTLGASDVTRGTGR